MRYPFCTDHPTESGSSEVSKFTDVARSGGQTVARRAVARTMTRGPSVPPPIRDGGPFEQVDTDFGPLWMQTSDEVMRPYLLRRRTWEESTAALLRRLLRPKARFLDVGANVGYFSLFAHRLAIDVQIDAVEPHPVLHGLLQSNLWANDVRVRTHNVAFGDTRRLLPMSSPAMNPGDSRVGARTPDGRYDLVVPVIPADELFERRTFDVVKIDVQGFEPDVILGMERIVSESPAIVLVVEFWPTALEERGLDPAEVLDRYRRLNFHIAVNDDGGTGTSSAEDVIAHCRSAGADGQVNLILRRDV
jgi:FkbM family methyltransferase